MKKYYLLIILFILLGGVAYYFWTNNFLIKSPEVDTTGNVEIKLIERFSGEVMSGNTVEIHNLNSDGSVDDKVLASSITDEQGIARFTLKKGIYRAVAPGGSTDFSLSVDDEEFRVTLYTFQVTN